jgi:FlaA1/EpsC-like NDP-sugar epimerase
MGPARSRWPARPGALVRSLVSRRRTALQVLLDMCAWGTAVTAATLARWDFATQSVYGRGLVVVALAAASVQGLAGYLTGLYRGRRRFGSFDEIAVLAPATLYTALVTFALVLVAGPPRLAPLSVPLSGGVVAFVLMGAVRYAWRLRLDRLRRPSGESAERLLVFGAGEAGAQVVTAMLHDPRSPYLPVALLDDAPSRQRLRILGVPVVGRREDMDGAARAHDATAVLIAIPSADAALVGALTDIANAAGLRVMVLPPAAELLGDAAAVSDIRTLTEADLLGRHEIQTDVACIAGYLTGRRVLVTGAGGSIGSELCRQISRYAPAELLKLDRDESALHAVQLSLEGRALLDSDDMLLVDIRDRRRVEEVFAERRPEVVFHAAALKHLPLLEQAPGEGVWTNVLSTLDLLETASRHGVERFVNISTDKAADPVSVLGYTKRVAERLTAHTSLQATGTFLSVRFGNVLGSRGSVLTAFRSQLACGGPITVTHPDVTRYFMTVQEAVQLVIQAAAIADPGQVLVLDMGSPVRIASVAERLAAQSGRPVEIAYTGLRRGEKLHEVLFGRDEVDRRPVHPLISHVHVPPCPPEQARRLDPHAPRDVLVQDLVRVCAYPAASDRLAGRRLVRAQTGA